MIKNFKEFLNESILNEKVGSFQKLKFNSHTWHNDECDILEGQIDSDSFMTYIVYIKDPLHGKRKKGDESMEYYVGSNYNVGSKKKSYSRVYGPDEIPAKYKAMWNELKSVYEEKYKGKEHKKESVLNEASFNPEHPQYDEITGEFEELRSDLMDKHNMSQFQAAPIVAKNLALKYKISAKELLADYSYNEDGSQIDESIIVENKNLYQVVFQSKSSDGNWKDVKTFPSNSKFDLSIIFQDEIEKMKNEYKQDLPKFKTRTINRTN